MTQTKERLGYVDFCRGVAILLVVMGHMIQFNGIPNSNPVFEAIYAFHMPLFFAISGYITHKVTRITCGRQYLTFLKKKTISILIPYFVWLLLAGHYFFAERWEALSSYDVWQSVVGWSGLWFLKTLFIILVSYGLFNWTLHKFKGIGLLSLTVSFLPVLAFTVIIFTLKIEPANLFMYTFFFYVGTLITAIPKLEDFLMKDVPYTLCFTAFLVLVAHWSFDNRVAMDDVYKVIVSACSFVMLLGLSRKANIYPLVNNEIQKFGRNTLIIYVLQFHLCKFWTSSLTFLNGGGIRSSFLLSQPSFRFRSATSASCSPNVWARAAYCLSCCWVSEKGKEE